MEKDNSIYIEKNYGHIRLKLKEQMDMRGITRNALARRVNTRFEVIDKWYRNQVSEIDLDVLARICFVLDCRIEELIEYTNEA